MTIKQTKDWQASLEYHESLFSEKDASSDPSKRAQSLHAEEVRTTPLFTGDVLAAALDPQLDSGSCTPDVLPQYGLLAKVLDTFDGGKSHPVGLTDSDAKEVLNGQVTPTEPETKGQKDTRLFVNINTPWSAFICGSQGSGKSHTLSCMLEASLIKSKLGKLNHPLAAMVFHFDKFTGHSSSQICEAAYLSSSGIPVRVLVSPTNLNAMRKAYENLPGFPIFAKKPLVLPLFLQERHLNVQRMMKLMAVDDDSKAALYMEVRMGAGSFI